MSHHSLDKHYLDIAALITYDKERFLKAMCGTKKGLQLFQLATVFQQLSIGEDNEDLILTFLHNMDNSLINQTIPGINTSLLLSAVRSLKVRVVAELIKRGADLNYISPDQETITTNWDMFLVENNQQHSISLIKLLHSYGVNLAQDTPKYFSIVNAIYEHRVHMPNLINCIEKLGYKYTIPGDWDSDEDNEDDNDIYSDLYNNPGKTQNLYSF